MRKAKFFGLIVSALLGMVSSPVWAVEATPSPSVPEGSPTLVMTLKCGDVTIALRPDLAPRHVERIEELVREKFYDGLTFHRVIDGFMAQTGDPTGTGMGGSSKPDLKAEFSKAHFERGSVGMARAQDPNSANSQFFIMFADGGFLDGQYTLFGTVTQGMGCVDEITRGEPPAVPDRILRVRLGSP